MATHPITRRTPREKQKGEGYLHPTQDSLTLRAWEDPDFARQLNQIPASPLPPEMNSEEDVLLAFWEEVFEPL
jgi:hypothetical protein